MAACRAGTPGATSAFCKLLDAQLTEFPWSEARRAGADLARTHSSLARSLALADIVLIIHAVPMRNSRGERLKQWARNIKRDVVALWLAAHDARVPWYAKAFAAIVVAYALSPIDLIPDFIPIFGYLDDLLILPLGIMGAVRLIPKPVMTDLRVKAIGLHKPTSKAGLIIIVTIWLAVMAATAWLISQSC
jgi:uncharacterized membrane protein YkvA (DUF1232 family)